MNAILKRLASPKSIRLVILTLLLVTGIAGIAVQAKGPFIEVLTIKGPITPPLADYIQRGIREAERENYPMVVIEMDTPGGLDSAMRDIIQSMVNSPVPVIVYVAPSGARAASAGTFITMAADVAAMAPSTSIGAAHPVSVGGGDLPIVESEKILNDSVSYIRGLAQTHGRNADWAESAVRQSASINDGQALELNVIEMTAPDLETLLAQVNGRQVTKLAGQTVTLQTKDVPLYRFPMSFGENFLYVLSNPNIAFLLMGLAILGIITEIAHPGLILPGVVGTIALLLSLYSFGTLPVNWVGVGLILLAFGLFVAELFTSGMGILGAGGLVSLIIGSLVLFRGSTVFRIEPWVIILTVIVVGGIIAFVINRVVAIHGMKPASGRQEMVGMTAEVREKLAPEGTVLLLGELWTAVSESGEVAVGEEVVVTRTEGLKAYVKRK